MRRKQRDRICRALAKTRFRGERLSGTVLSSGGIRISCGQGRGFAFLDEDLILDGRESVGGSPTEIADQVVRHLERWTCEEEAEQERFVREA